MRYWWVNQNQTYRHEIDGGYLWSPKKNKNEARNQFYENMREVSPGDVVFSFKDTIILAIGIAESYCFESPKPVEFGSTGNYWKDVGWKVKVRFTPLTHQIRPKEHINLLLPFLPNKYSPLQANGNGLQSVYLASVNQDMAGVLINLIGPEVTLLLQASQTVQSNTVDDLDLSEQKIEQEIYQNTAINETEKLALVRARRGQGLFKERVREIETRCRITGVENPIHLIASHCKPWRDATDDERLNGENGLLLTPSIDHLFDRGFIGFENNGQLIISPVAHRPSLQLMGIEIEKSTNVGKFTSEQKRFLEFHREAVLLRIQR
jgi:hypothetical protein